MCHIKQKYMPKGHRLFFLFSCFAATFYTYNLPSCVMLKKIQSEKVKNADRQLYVKGEHFLKPHTKTNSNVRLETVKLLEENSHNAF